VSESCFKKTRGIGAEIQCRKYFVLQEKCASLWTNHNQTYTNWCTCTENGGCGVL